MTNSLNRAIIDGDRVFKATNVKKIHPVFLTLAEGLASVNMLRFIKIYNERICASNLLSNDGKKDPLVETEHQGIVGVELLVDPPFKTVQFYAIASFKKGYGRKMVAAVVEATPEDWSLVVAKDWSGGFWQKMKEEYSRIIVY